MCGYDLFVYWIGELCVLDIFVGMDGFVVCVVYVLCGWICEYGVEVIGNLCCMFDGCEWGIMLFIVGVYVVSFVINVCFVGMLVIGVDIYSYL